MKMFTSLFEAENRIKKGIWRPICIFLLMIIVGPLNGCILFSGFASGPFKPKSVKIDTKQLKISSQIEYAGGHLIAFVGKEYPVLSFIRESKIIWAYELNTEFEFQPTALFELKVEKGIFWDEVIFFSGGISEPGYCFVSPTKGVKSFFLYAH